MTLPGTSDTPSTEVAHASSFVNPLTGEALTLDSPTPDLAHALLAIREVESELRELKRAITRVVLGRQDQSASWSQRLDGLKITGQSPQPSEEWDGPALREALLDHVEAGRLSIEAVDAAVETVVEYRVRKAGVVKLRKVGGEVAATVNSLCQRSERERRVSVSRVA